MLKKIKEWVGNLGKVGNRQTKTGKGGEGKPLKGG
jgi:hypothetical protein